jgi:hypothetical protein
VDVVRLAVTFFFSTSMPAIARRACAGISVSGSSRPCASKKSAGS